MDIREAIENLVRKIDNIVADHWKQEGYTFSPPPTHEAILSRQWAKIVVREHKQDGSSHVARVYCFVCLQDGQTKSLGNLKAGDIHMAATFKQPAKHARGNVFKPNYEECLTPHGIVYLR